MVHDTLQRQPFVGLISEQTIDQIGSIGIHRVRKLHDLPISTDVVRVSLALAVLEPVEDETNGPEVGPLVARNKPS